MGQNLYRSNSCVLLELNLNKCRQNQKVFAHYKIADRACLAADLRQLCYKDWILSAFFSSPCFFMKITFSFSCQVSPRGWTLGHWQFQGLCVSCPPILTGCKVISFLIISKNFPGKDSDWPGLGHMASPIASRTQEHSCPRMEFQIGFKGEER